MNVRRSATVLASLLLSSSFAWAHKVRFVAFDLPVAAGKCQLIPATDSKKASIVELGISRFSAVVDLSPGSYKLVLPDGRTSGTLSLEGEAARKAIAIVLPGPEGTVSVLTTPDESASFAAGDRIFINATRAEIRVQIGDRNVVCKPASVQLVKPPGKIVDGRYPVRMGIQKDDKWVTFNSTWWPDDPTCRSLVLLYPNANTGVPGVKTIEEVPQKEQQ
ncbi:hypothetical protein KBB96_02770 [Luteolibacter ambystomatis]|uniref:Uncharacterized protein n=1 Tax=Luteolibacter ambystomatis TaxID=2824561 RepID=A0A975PFC8_9BACT|nr:hypothetical protein [Luteolibacter ambystomatis]QUE51820.1 hypothetical protein KBB96_02770 [Luteolibacter ambystomatis]